LREREKRNGVEGKMFIKVIFHRAGVVESNWEMCPKFIIEHLGYAVFAWSERMGFSMNFPYILYSIVIEYVIC